MGTTAATFIERVLCSLTNAQKSGELISKIKSELWRRDVVGKHCPAHQNPTQNLRKDFLGAIVRSDRWDAAEQGLGAVSLEETISISF